MKRSIFIISMALMASPAAALEKVVFGLNWLPVAEHGGFYQAQVDGTYAACGLDVEIIPGGPQVNNRALLLAGRIDFHMGTDMLQAFNAVEEDIPLVAVAASFQKNPRILLAHPGEAESLEDLAGTKKILVGDSMFQSDYQWLISEFGFTNEQREVYTYNAAPFLADKNMVMQGYVTSEPYLIEQVGGFVPDYFLLADYGYNSFATTIETMRSTIEERPETVKCFVEGSIIGWNNYLFGDNEEANALIQELNPEFTGDKIKFAIEQMVKFDMITGADAETLGVGALPDDTIESFFNAMVEAGVLDADLDWRKAYDSQFVNQGLGLDLRPSE